MKTQHIKRFVTLALAITLTLAMTACKPTPENRILTAQKVLSEAKSVHSVSTVDMGLSIMGQEMQMTTVSDVCMFSDPIKIKMETTLDLGAFGKKAASSYAQAGENGLTMYTNDGSGWVKQQMTMDMEQLMNSQKNMELYMKSISALSEAGEETIDGVETVKLTGVIIGDSINEILESTGSLESLEGMDLELDLASLYEDMGDIPMTMWLNKKTSVPVRYEVDMTEAIGTVMNRLMEQMGDQLMDVTMEVTKMYVVTDVISLNQVEDFSIPTEAKNAA